MASVPPPPEGAPPSIATPAKPTSRPTCTLRLGRDLEPNRGSSATIQRGTDATRSAVTPEGTHCSATTTAPFPPASMSGPLMAAARHWAPVGLGAPRARIQP